MKLDVKIAGLKEALGRLQRGQAALEDMSQMWRDVGDYMRKQTLRCFDGERAPDGTKWAPWSEKYKKRMEKLGKGGNKILANTGELRRSLNRIEFKDRVVVGSALPYAATHQFGDAGRNIPARTFLGLTEADRDEVRRRLKMYFDLAAKRGK